MWVVAGWVAAVAEGEAVVAAEEGAAEAAVDAVAEAAGVEAADSGLRLPVSVSR